MITADCDAIRDDLDAFADGELRGAELRRVADHIETCVRCAEEVQGRQILGSQIRDSVEPGYQVVVPAGLAAGVVARVRAESDFSWRALFSRAVEDWHYVIVGGGAVCATFLSMLLCSAILLFGTPVRNADSLSALGTSLRNSPGSLYAEVARPGSSSEVLVVQLDTGSGPSVPFPSNLWRPDEERLFVDALGAALVQRGAFVQLAAMPEAQRKNVEWLMDSVARARRAEPSVGPLRSLTVLRLHLVTNTDVTAKGLN